MVDKLRFHDVLTAGGLTDQPARKHADQQRETDRERVKKLIWRGVGAVSVVVIGVGGMTAAAFAAFGG